MIFLEIKKTNFAVVFVAVSTIVITGCNTFPRTGATSLSATLKQVQALEKKGEAILQKIVTLYAEHDEIEKKLSELKQGFGQEFQRRINTDTPLVRSVDEPDYEKRLDELRREFQELMKANDTSEKYAELLKKMENLERSDPTLPD